MKPKRKIGAPPKRAPKPGERFQLGVRVTPEMKQRLEVAAEESGRSLTQEAEIRLERSFDRQDLLPEVLTTAYGSKEVAGLIMLIGDALQNAGFGQHAVGRSWPEVLAEGRGAWMVNADAYAQATDAVHRVLEALRPQENHSPYKATARLPKGWITTIGNERVTIGKWCAELRLKSIRALGDICGSADDAPDPRDLAFEITVRNLLGVIANRIVITHPDDDHSSTESRLTAKGKHQEPNP